MRALYSASAYDELSGDTFPDLQLKNFVGRVMGARRRPVHKQDFFERARRSRAGRKFAPERVQTLAFRRGDAR